MLEQETESIITALTERTIGRRDVVSLKEALTAEMPRGVKAYLQAEVIRWLRADLAAAPRFGRVSTAAPGIAELTAAFLRSLAQGYSFTRTDFSSILADAVHFTENFLCRPQWTLSTFLFESSPVIKPEEMYFRLGYTADYSYFRRLIEKVVRQWNWKEVRAEDFRMLAEKVDGQVVRQHTAQELAMLTKPIYDFLAMGDASRNFAIPLSVILIFFDDKKMSNVKSHIENICRIRGRSELTLKELASLIEDVSITPPGTKPPAPTAAPPAMSAAPADQTPPPPPDETDRAIQLALDGPLKPPEEEPLPLEGDAAGLPDIHMIITEKERSRFLKKLFKKDEDYYTTFIGELNTSPTWKDATVLLNRFFQENQIDPFSDEAVEFTDAIQARYLNRPA
jgi:hypothetical protein